MAHSREAGAALLEALVALAILGAAGTAVMQQLGQVAETARQLREAETAMAETDAFLHAIALWPAEELDQRLGERRNGPWRLGIQRERPGLYAIELHDSTGAALLLSTWTYRPIVTPDE